MYVCLRSGSATLQQLPAQWLKEVLDEVKCSDPSSKLCATRRSAGIPFYIQVTIVPPALCVCVFEGGGVKGPSHANKVLTKYSGSDIGAQNDKFNPNLSLTSEQWLAQYYTILLT